MESISSIRSRPQSAATLQSPQHGHDQTTFKTTERQEAVLDEKKKYDHTNHRLEWSGITYDIPLPALSRKTKKAQKSDVEAGVNIPSTRRILDGLEGHVDSGG